MNILSTLFKRVKRILRGNALTSESKDNVFDNTEKTTESEDAVIKSPKIRQQHPEFSMAEVIRKNKTLCKVSQSHEGLSAENFYISYKTGKVAEDLEDGLSFTTGEYILRCIDYGDQLTIFETDENVLAKHNILNEPVVCTNNSLGELITYRLLTKDVLSYADPQTFLKMMQMSSPECLCTFICWNSKGEIEKMLREKGFDRSADFLSFQRTRNYPDPSSICSADAVAHRIKANIVFDYIDWINELEEVKNYQSDPNKVVHGQTDSIDLSVCDLEEIIPFVPIDMPCTQQIRGNAVVNYDEPER